MFIKITHLIFLFTKEKEQQPLNNWYLGGQQISSLLTSASVKYPSVDEQTYKKKKLT